MTGLFNFILATARGWSRDSLLAARFLTRLPLGGAQVIDDPRSLAVDDGRPLAVDDGRPLADAARAFPLVGLLVGLIAGAALWAGVSLGLPPLLSALLALAVAAFITGALHEDGLADTMDGLGGGGTRDDKLAIMRDSRIGAFGTLALVFSVAIRAAALSGMRDDAAALVALIAAAVLSRAVLPALMAAFEPARNDGLAAHAGRPDTDGVATAAVLGVLLALLLAGFAAGAAAVLAAGGAAFLVARFAAARLGGITGDVLGAVQQAAEIAALLALAWALQ